MSDTVELIDKNVDKLVEAIKQAGPSAEYGLQETLRYISVSAWGELVALVSFLLIGVIGLFFGIRFAVKVNWADKSIPAIVIPGFIAFFSGLLVFIRFPEAIAMATHPAGHLVMQALK